MTRRTAHVISFVFLLMALFVFSVPGYEQNISGISDALNDIPDQTPITFHVPDSQAVPNTSDLNPMLKMSSSLIGGDIGWFEITSDPGKAQVTFDGAIVGYTPITVEVYSTGTPSHTVKVEKSGYLPWIRTMDENPAAGQTIPIFANLVPDPCCMSLRVTSAPSGAQITLNGVYMGITPKSIENLPAGNYLLILTRHGYETWTGTVSVKPDSENSIYVVMEPTFAPITSGTLYVESSPEGAEIILDRTSRGTTPRTLTLPEGQHTLVLKFPGYEQYSTSVYTRDKENSRVMAYLVPLGSLPIPSHITSPIIAASSVNLSPYEYLVECVDRAHAYMREHGMVAFLAVANDPEGELTHDTAYSTVIAENGTLLADPYAHSPIGTVILNSTDYNGVPYGLVRQAIARHGGGLIYEAASTQNASPQVLISQVSPISDGIIISASQSLNITIPLIEADLIESLSASELHASYTKSMIREVVIPTASDGIERNGDYEQIFPTDPNGVKIYEILPVLASEGGGLCYGIEPNGTQITLFKVSPITNGQITVRWLIATEKIKPTQEVIHS